MSAAKEQCALGKRIVNENESTTTDYGYYFTLLSWKLWLANANKDSFLRFHRFLFITFSFPLGMPKFSASSPKGRLLTPREGCGYSKIQNNRIVGGMEAKPGK